MAGMYVLFRVPMQDKTPAGRIYSGTAY